MLHLQFKYERRATLHLHTRLQIEIITCFQNSTIIGDTYCLDPSPLPPYPPSIMGVLDPRLKKTYVHRKNYDMNLLA